MGAGRNLALTGVCLSLIVFLIALFVHNALFDKDLDRAERLTTDVRGRLDAPTGGTPEGSSGEEERGPLDRFESVLTQSPDLAPVDALPFYDEGERARFARSRWAGDPPSDRDEAALTPPYAVVAEYEAGAVALRWEADPACLALAGTLPEGQQLVWRIYRARDLAEAEPVAELPLEARRWRDDSLPLAACRMTYLVWAALLDGPHLLGAEPADAAAVEVPERFVLSLLGGDERRARFALGAGSGRQAVATVELEASPGEPVASEALPTELTLETLQVVDVERLVTRERLQFRADGSLVLDPADGTPRRTENQVLVSVRRLSATRRDSLGVPRTLELDLP